MAVVQGQVLSAQRSKINNEASLLTQKLATEAAQTSGTTASTNGSIGKQMEVFDAQVNAFKTDGQQKVAKVLSDIYAVTRGTNEDFDNPNSVQYTKFDSTLTTLKSDVGLP